jgi:hypothetical protein
MFQLTKSQANGDTKMTNNEYSPAVTKTASVDKWFFAYVDLLWDKVRDSDKTNYTASELIALLDQLKSHGYTVVVLSSFQLGMESLMDPDSEEEAAMKVQANLKKIFHAVAKRDMTIIPEVMPVGASQSILLENRNLAEGTPVKEMTFRVTRGDNDQLLAMPNGRNLLSFENVASTMWCQMRITPQNQ